MARATTTARTMSVNTRMLKIMSDARRRESDRWELLTDERRRVWRALHEPSRSVLNLRSLVFLSFYL
jgi:hypothetical protein